MKKKTRNNKNALHFREKMKLNCKTEKYFRKSLIIRITKDYLKNS